MSVLALVSTDCWQPLLSIVFYSQLCLQTTFLNNFDFRKHFVFPCPSILPLFSILFIFFFPLRQDFPVSLELAIYQSGLDCLFASQLLGLQSCAYNLVAEKVVVIFPLLLAFICCYLPTFIDRLRLDNKSHLKLSFKCIACLASKRNIISSIQMGYLKGVKLSTASIQNYFLSKVNLSLYYFIKLHCSPFSSYLAYDNHEHLVYIWKLIPKKRQI